MQQELEICLMQTHEELSLQMRVTEDWKAEQKLLKTDISCLDTEIKKLEAELELARQHCGSFLSGMLANDQQLASLASVIPKYEKLREEISSLEAENKWFLDELMWLACYGYWCGKGTRGTGCLLLLWGGGDLSQRVGRETVLETMRPVDKNENCGSQKRLV